MQPSQVTLDAYKLKEDVVEQSQLDCIRRLAQPIVRDYIMLTTPLPTVFSSHRTYVGYECECEPWIFDQGENFHPSQSFRDWGVMSIMVCASRRAEGILGSMVESTSRIGTEVHRSLRHQHI
jgi:hypothetical protein